MKSKTPMHALLLAGLLIGLGLPMQAWAQSSTGQMDTQTPDDAAGGLDRCVENEGGTTLSDAVCYVRHREAVVAAQDEILRRINSALTRPGPSATDYARAAESLRNAQEHWLAYMRADCDVIDDVFGLGTALGLAGEDCVIRHYEARNQELRDLEDGYLQP